MKIQKTKFKLDHTSGKAGTEVKDLSTKKAAVADPRLQKNRLINVLMKVLNFS